MRSRTSELIMINRQLLLLKYRLYGALENNSLRSSVYPASRRNTTATEIYTCIASFFYALYNFIGFVIMYTCSERLRNVFSHTNFSSLLRIITLMIGVVVQTICLM